MKKIILLLGVVLFAIQVSVAQNPEGGKPKRSVPARGEKPQHFSPEQYVKMKTNFITRHAKLTQQEASTVMPLFHKQKELQRANDAKMRDLRKSVTENLSDAAALDIIKKLNALRVANEKIEKDYQTKILKVVSPLKYLRIINAESAFDREMLHKMVNNNPPKERVPDGKRRNHSAKGPQARHDAQ